jgi:hypothetical protein
MGLKATSVAAAFARLTVVSCFEYELVVVIGVVDLFDHVAIKAIPMAIPIMSKRFECFTIYNVVNHFAICMPQYANI